MKEFGLVMYGRSLSALRIRVYDRKLDDDVASNALHWNKQRLRRCLNIQNIIFNFIRLFHADFRTGQKINVTFVMC